MNVMDMLNNLDITHLVEKMDQPLPIFIYLILALSIIRIPYIRAFFSLCNTLLFEVIRVILEGSIGNKIILSSSGPTRPHVENAHFKNAFITYAGYTGVSFVSIGLFYLITKESYHLIFYLFICLMVVSALLWIRNIGGIVWAISFSVLLSSFIYFGQPLAIMHISIFLSSFILVQSVLNGIRLCKNYLFERKSPLRVGLFSKVRLVPTLMLGVLLLGQSLYAGYFIVNHFLSLY